MDALAVRSRVYSRFRSVQILPAPSFNEEIDEMAKIIKDDSCKLELTKEEAAALRLFLDGQIAKDPESAGLSSVQIDHIYGILNVLNDAYKG